MQVYVTLRCWFVSFRFFFFYCLERGVEQNSREAKVVDKTEKVISESGKVTAKPDKFDAESVNVATRPAASQSLGQIKEKRFSRISTKNTLNIIPGRKARPG